MQIQVGIITISDRASKGLYDDLGGPALKAAADAYGWRVLAEVARPGRQAGDPARRPRADCGGCHLILTTGGTGVAAARRDARGGARDWRARTAGLRRSHAPGIVKLTPNAILSRSLAVVVDKALVICLPGKPKGAVECLGFVAGAIPHCVEVLQGADKLLARKLIAKHCGVGCPAPLLHASEYCGRTSILWYCVPGKAAQGRALHDASRVRARSL